MKKPPPGWGRFRKDCNTCSCEERGACNPALLTGGSRSILRRGGDLADPRCVPLEAMDGGKTLADFAADRSEGAVETGVQLVAASLVLTVEDLIHHGEYPFLVFCFFKVRSEDVCCRSRPGVELARPAPAGARRRGLPRRDRRRWSFSREPQPPGWRVRSQGTDVGSVHKSRLPPLFCRRRFGGLGRGSHLVRRRLVSYLCFWSLRRQSKPRHGS